jgi:hypothetical protein
MLLHKETNVAPARLDSLHIAEKIEWLVVRAIRSKLRHLIYPVLFISRMYVAVLFEIWSPVRRMRAPLFTSKKREKNSSTCR